MKNRCLVSLAFVLLIGVCSSAMEAQSLLIPYSGNPVLTGSVIEPAVVYDSVSQSYRMWYLRPGAGVFMVRSFDGIAWTSPDTIAISPGSAGSYDSGIYTVTVVKLGVQFFMYYTAGRTPDTVSIYLATSPDGSNWTKHGVSPVLAPGAATWEYSKLLGGRIVQVNDTLYMMYSAAINANQKLGLATSVDGIHWVKSPMNPLIQSGNSSAPDAEFVGAAGLGYRNGTFYLIYRATDISGADSYSLATSSDGTVWQKYPGNPIYPSSRSGWNSYSIGGGTLLWVDGGFKYWFDGYGGSWSIGLADFSVGASINPSDLKFGATRVGKSDTMSVVVGNFLSADTLRITSIASSNPVFGATVGTLIVPPGGSRTLRVWYAPKATGRDSGSIGMTGNFGASLLRIAVAGSGLLFAEKPIFGDVSLVPNTYYQVRVNWFRSTHDSAGNADPVVQYSLWRQVPGLPTAGTSARPPSVTQPASTQIDPLWDFIETVPAMEFDEYSAVVPAVVNYNVQFSPNVFMVAAHTKNLQVYMSAPDTIVIDPPGVTGIGRPGSDRTVYAFTLDQNYPNPFNPSTVIRYGLLERSSVTLAVYNTLGQQVASLVDGVLEPGVHEVRFDATGLASGIYFYRIHAGSFVETRRLLLLR